jgi:NADH-quinone oxidoreductase subunit D
MPDRIAEYESLLLENEILQARARDTGILPADLAIAGSASGPVLRSTGVAWDIRKADPYCVYDRMDFDIAVGYQGDNYDRFLVRMEEMRQSVRIVRQALDQLPGGPYKTEIPLALKPPPGEAYARIESPKGELGFYLVSDGAPTPYRFHVRSPSLLNLTARKEMVVGQTVSDLGVTLGSIDINRGRWTASDAAKPPGRLVRLPRPLERCRAPELAEDIGPDWLVYVVSAVIGATAIFLRRGDRYRQHLV